MRKIINRVSGLCSLVGFLIVFCAAGSSDNFDIDFKTALVRTLIGLVFLFIGMAGSKLSKMEVNNEYWY